jgi:DNA repair protein RadC
MINQSAKHINIVSVKLVKESNLLYKERRISSPTDGFELAKQFMGDLDRENFVVLSLNVKNEPNCINCALQKVHLSEKY